LATDDTVTGDPIRLEQVFVNLLKNAIDAMEENKPRQLKVDIQRQDSSLVVDVTDSGPGIPEAVMSKLFDPFITTKPVGSGLGLGLSISYSIVSDMGGTIEASNQSEGGARFRVVLPATGEDHGRG
jgi:two-component system C4-dicarboxylate transport sensor histidine kinase DctB